jgi:serine/threonine protein kinase
MRKLRNNTTKKGVIKRKRGGAVKGGAVKGKGRDTKKRVTFKKRGGAVIGIGVVGAVHRPPLHCVNSNNSNKFNSDEYVSKITDDIVAKHEYNIAKYIKQKITDYSKYYCLVDYICPYSGETNNKMEIRVKNPYLAISRYCGISLHDIFDRHNENHNNIAENGANNGAESGAENGAGEREENMIVNENTIIAILRGLPNLIKGIQLLHNINIHHLDLHPGNVLYDNKSKKLYLIDFNLASTDVSKDPDVNFTEYDYYGIIKILDYISKEIVYSNILKYSNTFGDADVHYYLEEFLLRDKEMILDSQITVDERLAIYEHDINDFLENINNLLD